MEEDLVKLVKSNHVNGLNRKYSMEVKQKTKNNFYIVGVGASAGGLKAFMQLLEAIPANIGMAFILVQHLDPTKKSLLPETLTRITSLPLIEVNDGTIITKNHIYVIPSESYMTIVGNILHLTLRSKHSDDHKPIDLFFQSLAKYHHEQAIGIVLSGTGQDGTEGLLAIKNHGGITFAQDNSAQYKDMPQSAINSESVDFILPPDAMPQKLLQISRNIKYDPDSVQSSLLEAKDIDTVLILLKAKIGVDFRQYKASTVNRRIHRRMLLSHVDSLKAYAVFLSKNPQEIEVLYKDMLIHVTRFLREPAQFDALKRLVLPALLKDSSPKEPIKIWVPGCATGEEAYSLAIILKEFLGKKAPSFPIHIFATDIDEHAIAEAREGIYKEKITENVSPERIAEFFTKVNDRYKVKETIRDICEFAVADVTQKPLQFNFDLISCRNVLIYLGSALQQKAFLMLSSALKPDGFLLLGKSEGLGASAKLFSQIDSKQRIYSKKTIASVTQDLRKTINAQVGMNNSSLSSQKVTTSQPDDNHTTQQQKIIKLKEAVTLTQEYADEIMNELDVMNEEMQSANEELISSNEELQVANEEMTTLNEEVTIARDYADAIIRTVRGPLLVLSKDLRIISANESFYNAFKVAPNDTENRLLYDLGNRQWNIPKLKTLLEKILPKNNTLTDYEVVHDFKDIGQKTMLLNARTLQQGPDKTSLILLAIEDITDRRDIEKQKDLFIGIASHELKTPITTMKGYAQILEKRLSQREDSKDTYLIQNINKQTDRLTSLINDLLNTNNIQAGKLVLEKKRFNLNTLVAKTVVNFQYITETHKIIKEGEIKEQVFGDQNRIEQVLSNLITNAIKYSPMADKVIIRVGTEKNHAIVSVQDFGFGIEKRDQTKVFERFHRVGGQEEMNITGFGLGLYIAAEIIKSHHGRIWVESTKGKGSTFYFNLPLKKVA